MSNIEVKNVIYMDYNATTPPDPAVKESIIRGLDIWANPSSNTTLGKAAKCAIEKARNQMADMLGVNAEDAIFTSSGTESNNHVIHSAIGYYYNVMVVNNPKHIDKLPHIITTSIDHYSVRVPLEQFQNQKRCDVTFVDVDPETGTVRLGELVDCIRAETCLISVMLANNETGVIQPLQQIATIIEAQKIRFGHKILFHTDAAQAIGKIPVDMCGCDLMTIAGHKFYGPRIGALICHPIKDIPLFPLMYGAGQEGGQRPGTENTAYICGLGTAAQLVYENIESITLKLEEIRDYFESELKHGFGANVVIHFNNSNRLPSTSSVAFPTLSGTSTELLSKCKSFYASTGPACHSGRVRASAILLSCGIGEHLAARTVRFSVGKLTSKSDIDKVVSELKSVIL